MAVKTVDIRRKPRWGSFEGEEFGGGGGGGWK